MLISSHQKTKGQVEKLEARVAILASLSRNHQASRSLLTNSISPAHADNKCYPSALTSRLRSEYSLWNRPDKRERDGQHHNADSQQSNEGPRAQGPSLV